MTVSTGNYFKSAFGVTSGLGAKVINSDFTFVIKGFEQHYLLAKQCPWPVLAPSDAIEVPTILGAAMWEKSQAKFHQQGQVAFQETVVGHIDKLLVDLLARGGEFDATIYEGTPEHYLRAKPIYKCSMAAEPVDRDWENRAQPLIITGTMFYHYFGEIAAGNSADYR